MSFLSDRLKEARAHAGWTQMKAGEIAGIDYRTIQRWELDRSVPDRHRIMGLAYLYGRPLAWFYGKDSDYQPPLYREPLTERLGMLTRILRTAAWSNGSSLEELFGVEPSEDSSPDFSPRSAFPDVDSLERSARPIDWFPVAASAGAGSEVLSESRVHHVWLDAGWLRSHGLSPDFCDVISVRGDSMEPTLPDGCSILVDRFRPELREGRVFVLRTSSGLVVKRAGLVDGRWVLRSDNPIWDEVPVGPDDDVVGEVRWAGGLF